MNYGWGAVGHDSLVAVLASISRGEKILADAPYAELWVGAHAKAPALVAVALGQPDGNNQASMSV